MIQWWYDNNGMIMIWRWYDNDLMMIWRWYDDDDEIMVPLFCSIIRDGTRQFKNRAMQRHAQMLPACRCMARFLKGQREILKSLPRSSSRGGTYNDGIGVMVVGRGGRRGIGGVWWTQKVCATVGPKIKKARQTVPLAQRRKPMPPLLTSHFWEKSEWPTDESVEFTDFFIVLKKLHVSSFGGRLNWGGLLHHSLLPIPLLGLAKHEACTPPTATATATMRHETVIRSEHPYTSTFLFPIMELVLHGGL